MSPSARKVWIEIYLREYLRPVSLRSPSARKVWIEIPRLRFSELEGKVAFRKEGVD